MSKRVVFIHPGGLHEIMGTTDGMQELPITAEHFSATGGRLVPFASLVRVTPHAAYYREPMTPASYGSFNPAQR